MESNPGNPNPDLETLWGLILTQYAVIIVTIGLLCFFLWLIRRTPWYTRHTSSIHKNRSSSDLWFEFLPNTGPDYWFSDEGQKELYRDFSPN